MKDDVTFYDDKEIPEMDLEKQLAASVYLVESGVGVSGDMSEICYRLTVELARARHSLAEQTLQTAKYKALLKIERKLSDDILDENTELEATAEALAIEADMNASGMDEMSRRFDAALELLAEFTATVDWDSLLDEG